MTDTWAAPCTLSFTLSHYSLSTLKSQLFKMLHWKSFFPPLRRQKAITNHCELCSADVMSEQRMCTRLAPGKTLCADRRTPPSPIDGIILQYVAGERLVSAVRKGGVGRTALLRQLCPWQTMDGPGPSGCSSPGPTWCIHLLQPMGAINPSLTMVTGGDS